MNVQLTREEGRFVCEIERWHRIQFHSERLSHKLLLAVAAMIGVLIFTLALGNHSDPQVLWVSLPFALVTALRGKKANKVPFTADIVQLPQSTHERRLRNSGHCLVDRHPSILRTITPHVQREQIYFESSGAEFEEAGIQTPIAA